MVGVADNSGLVDGSDTDYQYDFNIKTVDEDNVSGYTYRIDAAGTEDENVVVTYQDFRRMLVMQISIMSIRVILYILIWIS